jgi:hypothetical protein
VDGSANIHLAWVDERDGYRQLYYAKGNTRTIYVPHDYPTIQQAINAAPEGYGIFVSAGTYYEHINFIGKRLTVKSKSGPADTIIDGKASDSVVTFYSGEGANSVLDGFTITNGRGSYTYGGGIHCRNSSPMIKNCIISGNLPKDMGVEFPALNPRPS